MNTGIDGVIEDCRVRAAEALDCPDLRKHKVRAISSSFLLSAVHPHYFWQYDLRVVLVHDGFYGRGHLYSYVKQKGVWWKVVDHTSTEVCHHI